MDMENELIDIHKVDRKLELTEQNINQDKKILHENKEQIFEYLELQKANGLKATTMNKDLYSIWFIAKNLNKPFLKCDKKDIVKICSIIEKQKWTAKTKQTHVVMMKKFFKWLYDIEEKNVYPKVVSWINSGTRTRTKKLPEEILSEDDIEKMALTTYDVRDKCLLLLGYESGARIGELLNIRIKHIVFNKFGAYVMLNGKTGMRRIPIVMSAPAIANLIDHHPLKDDRESFLFVTDWNARGGHRKEFVQLTYAGATKTLKKLAKRAGIEKRIYPHILRHSSATRAAKFMTEHEMKVYYGWTPGSNMTSIYVHLSSRDIEASVKRMNKVEVEKEQEIKATVLTCARCKQKNSFGSKFCNSCGYPLDLKTAMEIEDGRQSWDDKMSTIVRDKEIQNLILRKYGSLVKNK